MDVEKQIQNIIHHYNSGQLKLAERQCNVLLKNDNGCLKAQWLLLEVYLSQKKFEHLLDVLHLIITTQSDSLVYVSEVAAILVESKQVEIAQKCYLLYLDFYPQSSEVHYDCAVLQKKCGFLNQALSHYKQALDLNYKEAEAVHVNMAIIYSELRKEDLARKHLKIALKCKPNYVAALFNLATLHEEWGEKEQALELYLAILQLEPNNIEVATRIINAKTVNDSHNPILINLEKRLTNPQNISQIEKEAGHFALGKAYDDCQQFELAFKHYSQGNRYCAQRSGIYRTGEHEQYIQSVIQTFNKQSIIDNTQASHYEPVFICGMFRSGTSLIEQILAAHTDVTSGGELDLVSKLIKRSKKSFPSEFVGNNSLLEQFSERYKSGVEELFPGAGVVTDKRPDNFIYLGLLKAVYPKAKFVCTIRNPLDLCISVYFQHLGNELPYGHKLVDIAHYFSQYVRLLRHWKKMMPNDLLIVNYDELVLSQQATTESLLTFCSLTWQHECLEFYTHKNAVKTASVWQVRQPLYQTSLNRSKHYAEHLHQVESDLAKLLPNGYSDLI